MPPDPGTLTQRLGRFLADRFAHTRVLVWRDPSGILGPLLRAALPPDVEMPAYNGQNPLALRHAVDTADPWLDRRWLLYLTGLPDGWHCDWLLDYERAFGAVPQGDVSWALASFYGLVETPELRALLDTSAAREFVARFDLYFPGAPTKLGAEDVRAALLRAALRAPELDDDGLVLRYLTDDDAVSAWESLRLLPQLTRVVRDRMGLRRHLTEGHAPDRHALCRCMLASALVEQAGVDAGGLANHLPATEHRGRWSALLRRGMDDQERSARLAAVVQDAVEVSGSRLLDVLDHPETLAHGPPLPLLDRRILQLLYDAAPAETANRDAWWQEVQAVATTRARRTGLDPAARRRWNVIAAAASLLHEVSSHRRSLEQLGEQDLAGFVGAYLDREGSHHIDRLYRALPQDAGVVPPQWEEHLVAPARRAYHGFTARQTERFVRAVDLSGHYSAPGVLAHTDFWSSRVEPLEGVAVLCVDALRADLAWELVARMQTRRRDVDVQPALAQLPTRTEVGMAALLPGASTGFEVAVEGGALVARIAGVDVTGVEARKKQYARYFDARGRAWRRERIEDFIANDSAALHQCASAGVTPIGYTLDIDDNGEAAATLSWEVFDRALDRCEEFIDACLRAGFAQVVVGADHGFLVRDPDASPHAIQGTQAKGGGFVRAFRFAAGVGGVAPQLVTLTAAMLGRGGADVYVPRSTQCLGVQGGPSRFVHGGLSLQECALLLLTVRPGAAGAAKRPVRVSIEVPARATSLLVPVRVVVAAVELPLQFAAAEVRVALRSATEEVFRSEATRWQPATTEQSTTAMLRAPGGGRYRVALLDARDVVLQSAELEVEVHGDSLF